MSQVPRGGVGRVGTGRSGQWGPWHPLGSRVPPPASHYGVPYLYPWMPQKRRAGSKARVVKTRVSARAHVGSTFRPRKEKEALASGEGQSWRWGRGGRCTQVGASQAMLCCRGSTPGAHWLGGERLREGQTQVKKRALVHTPGENTEGRSFPGAGGAMERTVNVPHGNHRGLPEGGST